MATNDLTGVETDTEAQARIARIEQRMQDAADLRDLAADGDADTRETKTVTYPSYEAALAAGREIGASRADDNALMALFCVGPLQTLVGAVSPELVWEGAQAQSLTTRQLATLANSDVMAVSDLQWEPALDPASRLESVQAECRSRSAAAVTSADFDALLCVQDELAMCRCQVAASVVA